jgi:hypothetical protein
MPRSVSLVGLAQRGVIPQNNSTRQCSFCDPVVLTGTGRLWITDSKISHSSDTPEKLGKIQWMAFSVEIRLPRQ